MNARAVDALAGGEAGARAGNSEGSGAPGAQLDAVDRRILNSLQDGMEVCERPYARVAQALGLDEAELLRRLQRLLDAGVLTRFGPMYNAEAFGGAVALVAMRVPDDALERVAETGNGFAEVAHNYERDHPFNLWFVVATETPQRVAEVLAEIEARTGFEVFAMPKEEEFYVGLKLEV